MTDTRRLWLQQWAHEQRLRFRQEEYHVHGQLHRSKGHLQRFVLHLVRIAQGSVAGYKDVPTDSEQAMMSAVAQQHVTAAIEADQSSFQSHFSSVLTAMSSVSNGVDHEPEGRSWPRGGGVGKSAHNAPSLSSHSLIKCSLCSQRSSVVCA